MIHPESSVARLGFRLPIAAACLVANLVWAQPVADQSSQAAPFTIGAAMGATSPQPGQPPAAGRAQRDELLQADAATNPAPRDPLDAAGDGATIRFGGFLDGLAAYTYSNPAHWSRAVERLQLTAQGKFADEVKWKLGARVDVDPVYYASNFYPEPVKRNQRMDFFYRENYIDFPAADWDFRIGAQQIIWGEVVGLFFADVVSAKDLREFILPDFDILRIPQWAARAEYSRDDFHAELVWIPVPSYNDIGKPGAEFFPAVLPPPPGFATLFDNEQRPKRTLSDTNYGFRLSTLSNGWDISGFYYRSMDAAPTFYREIVATPAPAFVYQARHDRIAQGGGTLTKDFDAFVLKGELVYTRGHSFDVTRLSDADGVVAQNTLDWIVGLDFALPADTRLDVQLFQRVFFDHDPDIISDRLESGFSVLLNRKLTEHFEAEALWIASLNRTDWMLRPRVVWDFQKNWRLLFGVDVFKGPPLGFFGQFDNRDRVYAELRYSF